MKRLLTSMIAVALSAVALAGDAGAISGVVAGGQTGEPVRGAVVVARGASGETGRARTDARGRYLIDNLEPGRYRISASADGYLPAALPDAVPVRPGEVTGHVDFLLRSRPQHEPGAIAGRVTDRVTGEPVRGAVVTASGRLGSRRARTDRDGRYVIRGMRSGTYRVAVKARHYGSETCPRPVEVVSGRTTASIDFALIPRIRPGAIAGRVVDARTHEPLAGAVVVARSEYGSGRGIADRFGWYRIVRLAPGAYEVTAMKRGYRPESLTRPVMVHPSETTRNVDFRLRRQMPDAE